MSRLVRVADGAVICARCDVADGFWSRARGLLGRRGLDPDEGLLLRPCSSVHMAGMRFAIDAVFLDGELVVLDLVAGLRPWRAASRRGARAVLELPAGGAARAGLAAGHALRLE